MWVDKTMCMFKSTEMDGLKYVIQCFTNNQLLVNITDGNRFGTMISCSPMQLPDSEMLNMMGLSDIRGRDEDDIDFDEEPKAKEEEGQLLES